MLLEWPDGLKHAGLRIEHRQLGDDCVSQNLAGDLVQRLTIVAVQLCACQARKTFVQCSRPLFDVCDGSTDQLVGQILTTTARSIAQHIDGLNHTRAGI